MKWYRGWDQYQALEDFNQTINGRRWKMEEIMEAIFVGLIFTTVFVVGVALIGGLIGKIL